MHLKIKKFLLSFLIGFLLLNSYHIHADEAVSLITDYHSVFIPGYDDQGNLQIAIRMYYVKNIPYFLLVDPTTLITKVIAIENFKARSINPKTTPGYYTMTSLQETPYLKILTRYSSPPYLLQNYGLTQADHPVNGMFLTVDMCPSSKSSFEKDFFAQLVSLANTTGHPIPVTLSMSGLWMITHPKEFDWLIEQHRANKLSITWMNHSFSHVYYKDLPLEKNFMLTELSDFMYEILETEKILLQKQQLPSIFFRFPGLVANKELVLKLQKLGLIAVGSNAWLAKGEVAQAGSIILVHGNLNEPAGIKKVMPLLNQSDVRWLPLTEAVLPKK